ncbi:hypothetical protein OIU78_010558 [Salix suchowensis]|nr:hypothetical protein OIU78_010558 [Salix suchowensis]
MKTLRSFYTHKNLFLLKPNPISLSRHFHPISSPFVSKESGLAVHSSANDPIPIVTSKNTPLVWSVFDPTSDGTRAQSGSSSSAENGESELRPSSFNEEVDSLAGENLIKGDKTQMGLSSNRNEIEDLKKENRYVGVRKGSSVNGAVGSSDRAVFRTKGKSKISWVCEIWNKVSGIEASENAVRSWLPQKPGESGPLRLTDVNRGMNLLTWRVPLSGLFGSEVERVLGGGLVPGSLVLVGGDPGVGKSTLVLQVAGIIADSEDLGGPAPVVYVSGEESVEQIGIRADRLEIGTEELYLYSSTDIEDILRKIQHLSPRALIIDSIQTVYLKGVAGSAGGLTQVKECTSALLRFAKTTNIPIILIGHVNKAGDIAGPRVLEHIVDVVLYMEGEKYSSHRLLRPVKNRFGSTDELGVFEMSQSGLAVVSNPIFLIEIQALCVSGSSVSRHINGIQSS